MKFLKWLLEPDNKGKNAKSDAMPDFKKIFDSMPDIVNATEIKPDDSKQTSYAPSSLERDAARNIAEDKAKAAISKDKIKEVYARIQTAMGREKEIVWLLRTDKETPHTCLKDLLKSYRNIVDKKSYRGMSVNYVSEGKLREISPLDERDVEGLDQQLYADKKAGKEASPQKDKGKSGVNGAA